MKPSDAIYTSTRNNNSMVASDLMNTFMHLVTVSSASRLYHIQHY